MPDYRNVKTGVIVSIPADLAERIGGYEPLGAVDRGGATTSKPASRKTRRTSDDA